MNIFRKIDSWLNSITMYRLLMYGLIIITLIGTGLSFFGVLAINGLGLIASTFLLVSVCYLSNRLLALLFHAQVNSESAIITGLILACLIRPPKTITEGLGIAAVGIISMASKYILAIRHKHAFNPAAIAILIGSQFGLISAVWWIGSPAMFIPVLILGILVVRKTRHFRMVGVFTVTALVIMLIASGLASEPPAQTLTNAFLSWPLVFFATIMLTEPATMPGDKYYQTLFAILVGAIFGSQLKLGPIASSPQLALVAGNIFAYLVNVQDRLVLTLNSRHQINPQIFDFVFNLEPGRHLKYQPGQYIDWTLPHKSPDSRGNRRTFTIASSPTENHIHLGAKFYQPSSSFKNALMNLKVGDKISVSQLAGGFTLPTSADQPLIFIAGGIGITPFRSMVKFLIDTGQFRQMTLFYLINDPTEAAYKEVFDAAKVVGLKTVYVFAKSAVPDGWYGYSGLLNHEIIAHQATQYQKSRIYISGPNGMVEHFKADLKQHNVPAKNIETDYFPGY